MSLFQLIRCLLTPVLPSVYAESPVSRVNPEELTKNNKTTVLFMPGTEPCNPEVVAEDQLTEPPIPAEMQNYAANVQASIDREGEDLFRNESAKHAAVILRLFFKNAKRSLYIFCRQMSSSVYGELGYFVQNAIARGVDVKMITEQSCVESQETSTILLNHDRWRVNEQSASLPHFALADGVMYRLETDRKEKKAVVCTHVADGDEEALDLVDSMKTLFKLMWDDGKKPVFTKQC